jgi:hypothetical protein
VYGVDDIVVPVADCASDRDKERPVRLAMGLRQLINPTRIESKLDELLGIGWPAQFPSGGIDQILKGDHLWLTWPARTGQKWQLIGAIIVLSDSLSSTGAEWG